ncbi:molecular chaperone HtpG [Buchnera aphidicola]|uniref:molecular chaperone HtpG n=1 Tax=Buchnera aphidicola TaxID=9 RepID=UPI003464B580
MNNQTKYNFQSETKQLLKLMIHSLYSNKEIFLRELISNASDAIDKMRFQLLSCPEDNNQYQDMKIKIILDKKEKKIIISDNGIGMNKQEVINNIGTIANSGTKSFLKSLNPENEKNNQLIGKFGVGFYSSFIVSKKVIIRTRHFKEKKPEKSILWESCGEGEYIISNTSKSENGTDIELYLKENEKDFLENWKIEQIIKKYSDHISVPIEIQEYNTKNKTISWKKINEAQALWTMQKNQITEKKYQNFYKHITKDINNPIIWSHNKIEGTQEYTILLYIPSKSTWDLWNQDNKKNGLKLYVKKVYIMDDADQFLPNYLRFIKGIIDTNDLPLNVSREILQENHITQSLKKSLTKKVLHLIEKLSKEKEKYSIFWKEFGLILKEGIAEDPSNQETIANLLRFTSINSNDIEQKLSLNKYIQNMQEKQEKIYFITAENYKNAKNSPYLEIFKEQKIDVLLLSDRIDEWMMNYLLEFKGKKFQPVNKIDQDLEKIIKKEKKSDFSENEINQFLKITKEILNEKVESVKLSYRLINTPTILITQNNSMSAQMSKLFKDAGQNVPPLKYIFEINPNHELIKKIIQIKDHKKLKTWINILFDQALLAERGSLENPNDFINRINKILINT